MRVVRDMPRLRAARPLSRSVPVAVSFELPTAEPLSREPKVAMLDGGLPDKHVLGDHVLPTHPASRIDELLPHRWTPAASA